MIGGRVKASIFILSDYPLKPVHVTTVKGKIIYKAWLWGLSVRLDYKGDTLSGWRSKFMTHEDFNSKYYLTEPGTDTGAQDGAGADKEGGYGLPYPF